MSAGGDGDASTWLTTNCSSSIKYIMNCGYIFVRARPEERAHGVQAHYEQYEERTKSG